MKAPAYFLLVMFANFFAVVFRQEVTVFDRIASWFEPTAEPFHPKLNEDYWNIPEGAKDIGL